MKCKCKELKLKDGHRVIKTSEFLGRPIHLGKISEGEYDFYSEFFPEAFEINCTCPEIKEPIKRKSTRKTKKNDSPNTESNK